MSRFQFGVCEFSFPCWGPLALQMAHEAGFTGMQLADAGGSANSYPLNNKRVQESYLEAAAKYGIRGIPTLMLFKDGRAAATKVGALSKSQLTAFLDGAL